MSKESLQDFNKEISSNSIHQDELENQLKKIRGHFNGNQESIAILLDAIESTLKSTNSNLNPTSYYLALISTLSSTINKLKTETQIETETQTENSNPNVQLDLFYLLDIVIKFLSPSTLLNQSNTILNLIKPIFQFHNSLSFQLLNSSRYLRSILSIILNIHSNLVSFNQFNSNKLVQSNLKLICLSNSLLSLITSNQSKIRKLVQNFYTNLISKIPIPLSSHPFIIPISKFALNELENSINNYNNSKSKDLNQSITLIISILNFFKSFLNQLSIEFIDNLLSIAFLLPKFNNSFISISLFDLLDSLFGPNSNLDEDRIISILKNLLDLDQALLNHPNSISTWLHTLENGWITLARISPSNCSNQIFKIGKLNQLFEFFHHSDKSVRSSIKNFMIGIYRYCITDQEIQEFSKQSENQSSFTSEFNHQNQTTTKLIHQLILSGLNSTELIAIGGIIELIESLKSLILRFRNKSKFKNQNQSPDGNQILKDLILILDNLRFKKIGLESLIDEIFSIISEIFGPKFILSLLPLNLNISLKNQGGNQENQKIQENQLQGRAWLLNNLKIFNSSLDHFISYFLPLSENLFESKSQLMKNSKNADLLKIKIYDTLIEQIWRLLPGYCDLPWDLMAAFDKSFAEVLTQVLYTQPTLRPPILNALKILVDKNLTLANRSPSTPVEDEFGFSPVAHVNHLKSFAPNFLAVLFNVYCSPIKESSSNSSSSKGPSTCQNHNLNRGYMVDCMRSFLKLLDDQEVTNTYLKIKNILNPTSKSNLEVNDKILSMLDLLLVILPSLVGNPKVTTPDRLRELKDLLSSDHLLFSKDVNLLKKVLKILTNFVELIGQQSKSGILDDLDGFITKVIEGEKWQKIPGQAKKDRALLVSALVNLIPNDKLHYIPKILTEVVLGCKESNSETRAVSYDALMKLGQKMMESGGKVNWKALMKDATGNEQDLEEDHEIIVTEQDANIEEYFKMICAGLAGNSPHMISATITALSRVLFEFHTELSRLTTDELISTIEIFLNSSNREIAKSAIGFMKVAILSLPKEQVQEHLEKIVPSLLRWANEHKNFFKANVQSVMERLIRKFGFELIEKYVSKDENDGGRKLMNGLRRKHNRQKKKKKEKRQRDESDEEGSDEDYQPTRGRLNDAYEEALYGSSSSSDNESDDEQYNEGGVKGSRGKKNVKERKKKEKSELVNRLLEDNENEVMDLLDGGRMMNRVMAERLSKVERRKRELEKTSNKYQKDSTTGKMIIEDEDDEKGMGSSGGVEESTNIYLEAIKSQDSLRKKGVGGGQVKIRQEGKGSNKMEDEEDEKISIEEKLSELNMNPKRKNREGERASKENGGRGSKRIKQSLGSEFKSKKSNGDQFQKGGIQPYGYLPLSSVNPKKKSNQKKGTNGNLGLRDIEIVKRKKK
ncbi:hypothetical protein O181_022567 [Austropuccinia psidii MF-1]|uniref:RRP12 HEAT domain-containing protein n=1 Tax=Austropuccinia psidii MF-1 TaxID=1389203 RepID=A0A9Q3CHS7_9BASI|nr:hypothetical protein [Austropuccinia psidii MF-1]